MEISRLPNENEEQFIFRIGQLKDQGLISESWDEIADIINTEFKKDWTQYKKGKTYAKIYSEVRNFYNAGVFDSENTDVQKLQELKESIRKEKAKLQTLNIERNRIDRASARQELYYEQIASACSSLPLPDFKPLKEYVSDNFKKEYLLTIADVHYGASFELERKEYSPEIVKEEFEILVNRLITFIEDKNVQHLHIVSLGDLLQGVLRINDLKINDSSVVQATVEISRLMAMFLVELSEFVEIDYYHVTRANHTQIRPLGSKASELMDEDLEYIIGHYIQDLCAGNERIEVHLPKDGEDFIEIPILGYEILAGHGHQIKNLENSLKDLSTSRNELIDYLILGHLHGKRTVPGWAGCCHDTEVIVCPSFMGTDPYAKSIMKSSHGAVQILGFDEIYGLVDTHKIIVD